jgi:ATP-dependent RNA helicase DeaD
MTFHELGLKPELLQAVEALGFTEATPIQEKAIPVLVSGTKDFIGLAQTGTGKTAAFGLPLLQLIDTSNKIPQALVVCPTRELCMQIVKDFVNFKRELPDVFVAAVYGGTSISMQIRDLKKGVQIVVATPGRLIDLIERNAIDLNNINYVVLDEADEMLNMGFQEDIEFILKNTPNRNATWLFSATMPPEIRRVSKRYMNEPAEVSVGAVNTTNENILHQYYLVAHHHRYEALKRLIDHNPGMYGIIFTQTKMDAQDVCEKLIREGYDVDALHGDLSQQQRDKVMRSFREKSLQLLIATDVAARGIDVKGITHVLNYELPQDIESYTHRSGRTARAGQTGVCMSIVSPKEQGKLRGIEKISKAKLHKADVPTGTEACRKQFFYFMDKVHNTDISHGEYEKYLPDLQERFADMTKEEILQRVSALEFDRFLKYYENAEDLNKRDSKKTRDNADSRDSSGEGGRKFGGSGYTSLFINLGTKDGFYKASFLQFVLDMSDLDKAALGNIDMRDAFSWIEVQPAVADNMMQALDGKSFKGRKIRINPSDRQGGGGGGRGRSSGGGERGNFGRGERSSGGSFNRGGGSRRGSSYGDRDRGGSRGGEKSSSRGSYGDRAPRAGGDRAPRTGGDRPPRASGDRNQKASDRVDSYKPRSASKKDDFKPSFDKDVKRTWDDDLKM